MASLKHPFSQCSANLKPRCQKRSCSHRDCPHQGCSHVCPNILWCTQCTRFWCEDCWEEVDAHGPIDVEVAGMKTHEKTIPRLAGRVKSIRQPKGTISEEGATKHSWMSPQEQGNVAQVPHVPDTYSNPAERGAMKRPHTRHFGSPTPLSTAQSWALQDYETQLMLLKHQNKKRLLMAAQEQDKMAEASHVPSTSTHPTDQIERGTMEQPQTGQSGSPTSLSATQS
jgi:hypothetical protein